MFVPQIKYAAIFVGCMAIIASVVSDPVIYALLKPLVHILLVIYYVSATRVFNTLFLLSVMLVMIAEILVSLDFLSYYHLIIFLFTGYFIINAYLLRPVLIRSSVDLKNVDVLFTGITISLIIYLLFAVLMLTLGELPDVWMIIPGLVALLVYVGSCFFMYLFNRHSVNSLLLFSGIGYTAIVLITFIYEFILHYQLVLGMANVFELVAQVSFVTYLTKMNVVLKGDRNFVI